MKIELKTKRLFLRQIMEQDFPFLLALELRPETNAYETGGVPEREELLERCEWFLHHTEELPKKGGIRLVVQEETMEKIGEISLSCNWEEAGEWEIGYSFLKEYWGNGYATEALQCVIVTLFEEWQIHKLIAFIAADNERSIALAKRLRMVKEGHMRACRYVDGVWLDECVYTVLDTDRSWT